MRHRLAGVVGQQVLLRDIGHVGGLRVLGQQVIEGLVAARADFLGNRGQPLLGVGEHRIDIEDHAPERIEAVLHHLSDGELGFTHGRTAGSGLGSLVGDVHGTNCACERGGNQRMPPGQFYIALQQSGLGFRSSERKKATIPAARVDVGTPPVDSASLVLQGIWRWPMV